MDGVKRSRTAQGVAAERAVLTSMGVLADPFARTMLSPSMRRALWLVDHGPHCIWMRSVTLAGLAARVLWFDAQVTDALTSGIKQIAVIGAGYDSRAWRIHGDGAQYFELDHAGTQRDKVRRAPASGPVFVECDLTTGDTASSLLGHGFDPSRPALFVVEGVTMYLRQEVVQRLLNRLVTISTGESRLVVDFYPPSAVGTSKDHRQLRLQRLARTGSSESFRLTLDRAEAGELVQNSGWDVDVVLSMREAARMLVPRASGLPVDAVNEHKTLVAARMP